MGPIISSLNLLKFRGIQNLNLPNLAQINVLVGANNSGKTSILEAVQLLAQPEDIGTLMKVALLRAPSKKRVEKVVEYFSPLFTKEMDHTGTALYSLNLEITANGQLYSYEAGGDIGTLTDITGRSSKTFSFTTKVTQKDKKPVYFTHRIQNGTLESFEASQEPLYQGAYLHSNASFYSSCVTFLSDSIINEQKNEILNIIQSFDPNVEDISIVGEDIYLHNTVSGTLPLFSYGSGLQKAVLLTALLANSRNGVVLIDEIDNTINISAFHEVFSWFVDACMRLNVQAFVTTHSEEALDAILESSDETEQEHIRIITLRKDSEQQKTTAVIRTGKTALLERSQFEMELRV